MLDLRTENKKNSINDINISLFIKKNYKKIIILLIIGLFVAFPSQIGYYSSIWVNKLFGTFVKNLWFIK